MSQLYRIHVDSKKTLQNVKEIEFADHKFKERFDIQEWIESTPKILGEELLIIAKEKAAFEGTRERPDLIAIDKEGNIVIIELKKRDSSGADVHWQAIKYASYWSRFEINHIIDIYKDYLFSSENEDYSEEVVQGRILDFIEKDDLEGLNFKQRIIMASHRFSKEVVTAAKWLIDEYRMDLKCVQIIPFYDDDIKVYNLHSNTLLPLPEIDEYLVNPSTKSEYVVSAKGPVRKDDSITEFAESLRDNIIDSEELKFRPNKKNSRWAGVDSTFRYYHFWFKNGYWSNWNMSYRLWRFNEFADEEEENKFALYLTLNKKNLLSDGMTEVEYNKIGKFLEKHKIDGFEYEFDEEYMALGKVFETNELTMDMQNSLQTDLIRLINSTKGEIDKITNLQ